MGKFAQIKGFTGDKISKAVAAIKAKSALAVKRGFITHRASKKWRYQMIVAVSDKILIRHHGGGIAITQANRFAAAVVDGRPHAINIIKIKRRHLSRDNEQER